MELAGVALLVAGLLTGGAIGWLLASQKMGKEIVRSEERMKAQVELESKLKLSLIHI